MAIARIPLVERFWPKVDKTPGLGRDGACWLWTAALDTDGYGMIGLEGVRKNGKAHRISYELANGPIPAGLLIRHECDTPACVNPAHLLLGMQADNMADMAARQRHPFAKATHCPRGHEYTAENTCRPKAGGRACRLCLQANERARYRKNNPAKPYEPTGRTCKTCAATEPEVKFRKDCTECSKCQYQAAKDKRGVWNKQRQLEATAA